MGGEGCGTVDGGAGADSRAVIVKIQAVINQTTHFFWWQLK